MAQIKHVLLVTTQVFTPYAKDEVFGVEESVAQKLLSAPEPKVRLFDPKKDQAVLDGMSGRRPDEVTPEVVVTNAPENNDPLKGAADKSVDPKAVKE